MVVQRKHDLVVQSKNSEIQRFRMELDALLNAVQHVQHTRRKKNKSGTVNSTESSP